MFSQRIYKEGVQNMKINFLKMVQGNSGCGFKRLFFDIEGSKEIA